MHLFNIYHYRLLSLQQLEEYLLRHNSLRYQIIIPKKEWEYDTNFLRWQYYMAAYAGHRLSLVSTSFAYNVPCHLRSDPFTFEIEYTCEKKLAAVIYQIIKGYYTTRQSARSFQDAAIRHFHDCLTGKSESACFGLLHTANTKSF